MLFQEGQEGKSGELQAGQPHISPCEDDHGATNSGSLFQTHEGQGDQKKSMWIYPVEVRLNQADTFPQ